MIGLPLALLAVLLLLIAAAPLERLATSALGGTAAPDITGARIAAAVGAAFLATLVIGWVSSRRFALPLLATFAAGLPPLAAAGLLVSEFQEGRLEDLLDYTSNAAVQLGSLAAAVSIVAALCVAQAIALACAAGAGDRRDPLEAVRDGLARCGPAAATSSLAGIAAGVALAFGSERFLKEFGLGVAAGLGLALLLVQVLIAPALLRLTHRSSRDQ